MIGNEDEVERRKGDRACRRSSSSGRTGRDGGRRRRRDGRARFSRRGRQRPRRRRRVRGRARARPAPRTAPRGGGAPRHGRRSAGRRRSSLARRRCRASRSSKRRSCDRFAADGRRVGAGDPGVCRVAPPVLRRAGRLVRGRDGRRGDRARPDRRPLHRRGGGRALGAGRARERLRRHAVGALLAARHRLPRRG